jgi:hypothetical protein
MLFASSPCRHAGGSRPRGFKVTLAAHMIRSLTRRSSLAVPTPSLSSPVTPGCQSGPARLRDSAPPALLLQPGAAAATNRLQLRATPPVSETSSTRVTSHAKPPTQRGSDARRPYTPSDHRAQPLTTAHPAICIKQRAWPRFERPSKDPSRTPHLPLTLALDALSACRPHD